MLNKIKYQNPSFRRKLNEARGYKRKIKKIPETKFGFFLAVLHLDSLLGKTLLFITFLLLIYLVYAPNFLTIKNIQINGADSETKTSVEKSITDYLQSGAFLPRNNFLFLSKNNLAEYLTAKNLAVEKVVKIEKDLPNQLIIEISLRYDKFLLKNPTGLYTISNDGLVTKQLSAEDLTATNTPYSSLIVINLTESKIFYEKEKLANADYFASLNEIMNQVQNQLQNPIIEINLENFNRPDFETKTQRGFIIKFDINSDLSKIFGQLGLLLKDIGTARISGVKYIDMRIRDKGYVCYRDAACAVERSELIQTATSTSSN